MIARMYIHDIKLVEDEGDNFVSRLSISMLSGWLNIRGITSLAGIYIHDIKLDSLLYQ